jgi:serine/threonine protein kinase
MMSLIMKRTRLHHRNLSTIRSYRVDKQADLCSESVALSMYFEYFPHDLEKDIDGRLQDGRPFTTAEVCGLLYQLADCLHYLQSHNTYHGDIKASNVLLAPRVKLLDSYFTHLGKTNLQLVLTT